MDTKTKLLTLFLLFCGNLLDAQPLEQILNRAKQHSLAFQNLNELQAHYQALQKTLSKQPLAFTFDFGQINSIYNDNQITLEKEFINPWLFAKQKKALQENYQVQSTELEWQRHLLLIEIEKNYYTLQVLREAARKFLELDTLYAIALQKMQLRIQQGENIPSQIHLLKLQHAENQTYILNLHTSIQTLQTFLQWASQSQDSILPLPLDTKIFFTAFQTTPQNPYLTAMQLKINYQNTKIQLEQRKKIPNLRLAYTNKSILGYGADNLLYNSRNIRFHSASIGLSLPIYGKIFRNTIIAEKQYLKFLQNQSLLEQQKQQLILQQLNHKWKTQQQILKDYLDNYLPALREMSHIYLLNLQQGQMDFLEFWSFQKERTQLLKQFYAHLIEMINTLMEYKQWHVE